MLFAIICEDKPNSVALRQETRPKHLEHLNSLGQVVRLAGPFLNENGDPCGSFVVVETGSKSEAEEIAGRDPYALAGLFDRVTVRPWKLAINNTTTA